MYLYFIWNGIICLMCSLIFAINASTVCTQWFLELLIAFLSNACCGFHTLFFSTNLSNAFLHEIYNNAVLNAVLLKISTVSFQRKQINRQPS